MKHHLHRAFAVGIAFLTAGLLLITASAAAVLPGDVNGDGSVDIGDASLLLQHSLFPDLYPVSYKEGLDFDGDKAVNIRDVVRLIQYSLYPEDYPLVRTKAPASAGLAFVSKGDGTCLVTGIGTCTDTIINIPQTSPDGDTVVGIADRAFSGIESITDVILPETVTSIGVRAFYGCTGLTEFTIPESVTTFGTMIFYKASNLKTVYYNSDYGPTTSELSFFDYSNVEKIVFGGTVVPSYICYNASSIREIEISDSVTYIGFLSFYNCDSLISITIPDNVKNIDSFAFEK